MSDEKEIIKILRSLARSKMRMSVLNFMAEHSGVPFNASEIARALGIDYASVYGALNGGTGKYSSRDSLVGLGLVSREELRVANTVVYRVTALGFNASAAAHRR